MSQKRKREIIRKAAELFREKGYASSSMRDLAQKLDMEAASLYFHIKSKEEILQSLCFGMADAFRASLSKVERQNIPASEKLRLGIVGHVEVMTTNLISSAVFMNDHRHLSQPHLRNFLLLRINYINRFKHIIHAGIDSGEFKKKIDKKLAVMTLFSSFNWMPEWYTTQNKANAKEIGDQLAEMLINGLQEK